jgi:uncharacterized membrane protein
MAVCPTCGAEIEGGVCSRCSAPAEHKAAPAIDDNIANALCYLLLGVTGTLMLFLEPYRHNHRVRFHAFQAILLNLVIILVWLAISLLGSHLAMLLSPVFTLGTLVLWLLLIWTAWQNERIVLPVIGPLAEKQA